VATSKASSNEYTYGVSSQFIGRTPSHTDRWQWARAEILGGFVNGVFLIALCLTIFLEAIQRFFEPQEVSRPKFVLVVGGIGLAFNIFGLFVFHQHSHGHDHDHGESHSHDINDELSHAEQGHSGHQHASSEDMDKDLVTAVKDVTEHTNISSPKKQNGWFKSRPATLSWSEHRNSKDDETTPLPARRTSMNSRRSTARHRSGSRSYNGIEDLPIHPASLRNEIMAQARMDQGSDSDSYSESDDEVAIVEENGEPSEGSPLLSKGIPRKQSSRRKSYKRSKESDGGSSEDLMTHKNHKHAQPKSKSKGGHSHEDMNIKGVFLHVLGDALGNVGVMASALIIWLTPWSFRFYFDPAISLLITLIILKTAIPLVKQTSKPLLQAVPDHVNVDDIREDIESLPDIRSCHHVHVWALTPSKLIATLDVQLDFNFEGNGAARYMALVKEIKSCLHGYGIHSSTIQPEFCLDPHHAHAVSTGVDRQSPSSTFSTVISNGQGITPAKRAADGTACDNGECLLNCEDECESGPQCCGPGSGAATPKKPAADESHKHDHGKHR